MPPSDLIFKLSSRRQSSINFFLTIHLRFSVPLITGIPSFLVSTGNIVKYISPKKTISSSKIVIMIPARIVS